MIESLTEIKSQSGQRGLGLGFGTPPFRIFLNQPYAGFINPLTFPEGLLNKIRDKLHKAIENQQTDHILSIVRSALEESYIDIENDQIDDIMKNFFALIIPDILLDLTVTRLQKILPTIINKISPEAKQCFANEALSNFRDEESQRFLNSVIDSKYKLFYKDNIEKERNKKLDDIVNILKSPDAIQELDAEIMAYLIPVILDRMSNEDLKEASFALARELSLKDFKALSDEKYFVPKIAIREADSVKVTNSNRRSLQFFAQPSESAIGFRGKNYKLQHTHNHFWLEFESGCPKPYKPEYCPQEYVVYKDQSELDWTAKNPQEDPNNKFMGEIHNVFEYIVHGNNNKKRLMAIGFHVLEDKKENPHITKLLTAINELEEIKQWREALRRWRKDPEDQAKPTLTLNMAQLSGAINYQEAFLEPLKKAIDANTLMLHRWSSIRSNTYGFIRGLEFVLVPTPLKMSIKQCAALHEIFGEMVKDLKEEDKLDPIDRKAGHREIRQTISDYLSKVMEKLSRNTVKRQKLNEEEPPKTAFNFGMQ